MKRVFQGLRANNCAIVMMNGARFSYRPSLKLWNHSPAGFEWGYQGSGPAQLALAILALFLPAERAIELHQTFKREVIASLNRDGFLLTSDEVEQWIAKQASPPAKPPDEPPKPVADIVDIVDDD